MAEGSPRSRSEVVGSTTSYEQRFFFTLADSLSNRATVELGLGTPKSKVIADRAFNAIELNQRYAQFLGIASVDYNPTNDPTRSDVDVDARPFKNNPPASDARNGNMWPTALTRRVVVPRPLPARRLRRAPILVLAKG